MNVGRLPPTNPPLCIESVARARPKSCRKSQNCFLCCMQCFAAKAEYQRHQAGLSPVHALSSGLALISLSCDFLGKCRLLIGLGGRSCFFYRLRLITFDFDLSVFSFSLWRGFSPYGMDRVHTKTTNFCKGTVGSFHVKTPAKV